MVPGEAKKNKQQPQVDEAGSTMSQSDKDRDTNEDEDGGGGCGGGDGSNDSGCDKDKDGSASDEHGDNGMFADNRQHCLIKIRWNFMRDLLWKDITCLFTVIMSIGFNCITLKHFSLTVIYV